MTEAKKAAIMLYLNDECEGNSYEIFSDEDFLSLYPCALGVGREDIAAAIKTLGEEGCIDVRYAEGGTYCVSVLEKGRRYEPPKRVFQRVSPVKKRLFGVFGAAFCGGVCGGVFTFLFALLCGALR